ncbi:MAG: hypothetical protein WC655_21315, partial [Candidatus Hydrogenedentales bacterium]
YGLNANDGTGINGADGDPDFDGVSNSDEFVHNTSPASTDTDSDGLPDGWEILHNLNPTDNGSVDVNNGPNGDPDLDGATNTYEFLAGTDPRDPDSVPSLEGVPAAGPLALAGLAAILLALAVACVKAKRFCEGRNP